MRAKQLPFSGEFRQAVAFRVFGGVGVIDHAQKGVILRMILVGGVGHWWGKGKNFGNFRGGLRVSCPGYSSHNDIEAIAIFRVFWCPPYAGAGQQSR